MLSKLWFVPVLRYNAIAPCQSRRTTQLVSGPAPLPAATVVHASSMAATSMNVTPVIVNNVVNVDASLGDVWAAPQDALIPQRCHNTARAGTALRLSG